jgi:exodeoxyribonuclease-1
MRFIFYDTETTGTNRDFDQILQFAAIVTDENFAELDRFETRCRRLPWVIPAPAALLVTGVSPRKLDDPTLPAFLEMMEQIRSKLDAWSPAIFVGYNSMLFDEPLLQRAFWQALLPPYLTVTNGNRRSDLLPIVRASSILLKNALAYPKLPNGRLGFRLDALAPLNGHSHDRAHDALGDVQATIHVARRIAEKKPAFWSATLAKSQKSEIASLLRARSPVLIAEHALNGPTAWWGCGIDDDGGSPATYSTVARLDFDWLAFARDNDQRLLTDLRGTSPSIRRFALNKSPLIFSEAEALSMFDRAPSKGTLQQAAFLASDARIRASVKSLFQATRPAWPEPEALEQRMFERLPDRSDAELMERFHSATWPERAELIRAFSDGRYKQLAQRLVYVGAPEQLAPSDRGRISLAIRERIEENISSASVWRSIPLALKELNDLRRERGPLQELAEIEDWLLGLFKHGRGLDELEESSRD